MIYVPKLLQWLMSVGRFASSWVILCLYESYLYLLLALGTSSIYTVLMSWGS